MTDPDLRLPNSRLRAVLNLGPKRAASISLPQNLAQPELIADWDAEAPASSLLVAYESGELHIEFLDATIQHHFHLTDGNESDRSPWSRDDTDVLVRWATLLLLDFHEIAEQLVLDVSDAAAWLDEGFDLYVCEVEQPVALDLVEVEVEGEVFMLPWLGAGSVDHDHIDGDDHPIALLWSADGTPDRAIAEARVDPRNGATLTTAVPGVDWDAVGLPRDEVLSWLEGIYFNHHLKPDAEGVLLSAALSRMGGLG